MHACELNLEGWSFSYCLDRKMAFHLRDFLVIGYLIIHEYSKIFEHFKNWIYENLKFFVCQIIFEYVGSLQSKHKLKKKGKIKWDSCWHAIKNLQNSNKGVFFFFHMQFSTYSLAFIFRKIQNGRERIMWSFLRLDQFYWGGGLLFLVDSIY